LATLDGGVRISVREGKLQGVGGTGRQGRLPGLGAVPPAPPLLPLLPEGVVLPTRPPREVIRQTGGHPL